MSDGMLTIEGLKEALAGKVAAIRITTILEPVEGPGGKVFPPTYAGAQYAWEKRRILDDLVDCVLLDSVQSQANRFELALLKAHEAGELTFPLLAVEFPKAKFPDIPRITSLEAPHRVADAIFRDSLIKDGEAKVPFRKSTQGKNFEKATRANATALLEICPHALIFGTWDSTGAAGGSGNKFPRALVSEIVGLHAIVGVRTGSRLDPLGLRSRKLFRTKDGDWTPDETKANLDEKGKPETCKPSEVSHGNVTPDIIKDEQGNPLPGGVTISQAVQHTVISLPALRTLRFPTAEGISNPKRDLVARTLLAVLALASICKQRHEGYDLRSRCLLVPREEPQFELVYTAKDSRKFALDFDQAKKIFKHSVEEVRKEGFTWDETVQLLEPKENLQGLVEINLQP